MTTKSSLKALIAWPTPTPEQHAALRGCAGTLHGPGDLAAEVHTWAAVLDLAPDRVSAISKCLTLEERERASRFRFPVHRDRFIVSQVFLRSILSLYLGVPTSRLRFSRGPFGKPELTGAAARTGLRFNLTHSGELALVAITTAGPVGVDVEHVRILEDAEELVNRFFSTGEAARFRDLDTEERPVAFFNLWTRKEAWLKATGEGIGTSLNRVEVTFLPGEPAGLVRLPVELGESGSWFMQEIAPAPGFVGALAVNGPRLRPRSWCWDPTAGA